MAKLAARNSTRNEENGQAFEKLQAGDLFQRYRLQDELGRGPLATVYRAVDKESGQQVALKLFDARFRYEPQFAIRFRYHLKEIVGLEHDHLVTLLDYGLAGEHFYITTEMVEGQNLATLLAERGALSPAAAAEAARQASLALEAAHQRGLVHRNLKPENILLAESGGVKVADMGLSGLLSESGLSRTSVMLSGAGYMAPEQGHGQTAGPPADIYSLGVILFEMLTGRPPFVSSDLWQVVQMHLLTDPPSPREINPEVPPELATIVTQAMRKKPDDRFATAAEMASALATIAGRLELPPAPFPTGVGRWRLPAPGVLLGLQFIASFTVIFLLLMLLTGIVLGNSPDTTSGDEVQQQSIDNPSPTATTTATATPVIEATPTVAASGQAPAAGDHGEEVDGPPLWVGAGGRGNNSPPS